MKTSTAINVYATERIECEQYMIVTKGKSPQRPFKYGVKYENGTSTLHCSTCFKNLVQNETIRAHLMEEVRILITVVRILRLGLLLTFDSSEICLIPVFTSRRALVLNLETKLDKSE